jgi:hypothetical protein
MTEQAEKMFVPNTILQQIRFADQWALGAWGAQNFVGSDDEGSIVEMLTDTALPVAMNITIIIFEKWLNRHTECNSMSISFFLTCKYRRRHEIEKTILGPDELRFVRFNSNNQRGKR